MGVAKGRILLFLFLMAVWVLLTFPSGRDEILAGAVVSLIIALLPMGKKSGLSDFRTTPRALLYAILYVFVFLVALVRSNLDVAFRVIQPKLPINPGIVKVKTRLRSRMGRLILANSITLTPGTITVDTDGEDFYVHWIDVRSTDIEGATKEIVLGFEKYLEVICG